MNEEKLVDLLIKQKRHISFAESCTGGLAAATLINVPNASQVLDLSVVTYANVAKIKLVAVSETTIKKYGVVSEAVAAEMARGIAKLANCSVGVGISGIAGPSGATANKVVGQVCFGISLDGKDYTYTEYFGNIGRNEVRNAAVSFVFTKLLELLKDE